MASEVPVVTQIEWLQADPEVDEFDLMAHMSNGDVEYVNTVSSYGMELCKPYDQAMVGLTVALAARLHMALIVLDEYEAVEESGS